LLQAEVAVVKKVVALWWRRVGGYRTSVGTSGANSSAESKLSLTSGTGYTVTIGGGGAGGSNSTSGSILSIFYNHFRWWWRRWWQSNSLQLVVLVVVILQVGTRWR
jgi:hypothetical protein